MFAGTVGEGKCLTDDLPACLPGRYFFLNSCIFNGVQHLCLIDDSRKSYPGKR